MSSHSHRESSFAAGYLWTFGSTALPLAAAFVGSLIIARWLGPRVVGLVNWTMALATVLLIPGKFGVDSAASRLASEYEAGTPVLVPRLVRSALLMRLLFTLPVAAAAFLFAPVFARFFRETALVPLFRLSALLIVAVSINELVALLWIGLKRFRALFAMRLSMFVLRIGLVAAVVLAGSGGLGVIGAYAAAALVPGCFAALLLLRYRPAGASGKGTTGRRDVWERLLRLSIPLAISGASVTVYSLLDKLMIGYFRGASEVGLYSMARSLLETSLFPTFALVMTLRPVLAGAYASGRIADCSALIRRSIRGAIVYAGCILTVIACLSRPLVVGLFKDRFEVSADLLVFFLPMLVMRCVGSVILPGLIAAERASLYAKLTLTGAVLNFVLNALLIPRWGASGAVLSTLLSYLPIEIIGFYGLSRVFTGFWTRRDFTAAVRIGAASAAIIAVFRLLVPEPSGLPSTLIISAGLGILYVSLLLLLRVINPGEIREFIRRRVRGGAPTER